MTYTDFVVSFPKSTYIPPNRWYVFDQVSLFRFGPLAGLVATRDPSVHWSPSTTLCELVRILVAIDCARRL